jgi:hypothetical protein
LTCCAGNGNADGLFAHGGKLRSVENKRCGPLPTSMSARPSGTPDPRWRSLFKQSHKCKQTAFECTRENPDSSICLMSYIRYDGAPDMHLTRMLCPPS